jgi:hypothetical protein
LPSWLAPVQAIFDQLRIERRTKSREPVNPTEITGATNMKKIVLSLISAAMLASAGHAQIIVRSISEGITPQEMAALLTGGGVEVFDVQYSGAGIASGVFCSAGEIIGIENGILLTSGNVSNVIGPNVSAAAGQNNGFPGDADLDAIIAPNLTFDASVFSFNFIPDSDTVMIRYVFASEEYNEFVNSVFNDVFAFFVNGENFALIPGTMTPVSINNVNNGEAPAGQPANGPCMNCQFYRDNADLSNPPLNTEMDGLTTVLTLVAPVIAGETNTFKMAIADAGDGVLDSAVFIEARSLQSGEGSTQCVTRTVGHWFRHPRCPGSGDLLTATLDQALKIVMALNCDVLDLGFLPLPTTERNNDGVLDFKDALREALGLRWRSRRFTGEFGGLQTERLPNQRLCRQRKQLATQLIAAIANNALFDTRPENCTYTEKIGGKTIVKSFPETLLVDAREAARGEIVADIIEQKILLKKFNRSGNDQPTPAGIADCAAPLTLAQLRRLSRDPTTQMNCPGFNDGCDSAETISALPFSRRVNLSEHYTAQAVASTCGGGGADAIWKIHRSLTFAGRPFTVSTEGSNFDTIVSVRRACGGDELGEIACNDDDGGFRTSRVQFVVSDEDAGRDLFIIAEGKGGAVGTLKLQVTSP